MNITQAQKILADSRYGEGRKKEARKVLREAKKASKPLSTGKTRAKSKLKAKGRVAKGRVAKGRVAKGRAAKGRVAKGRGRSVRKATKRCTTTKRAKTPRLKTKKRHATKKTKRLVRKTKTSKARKLDNTSAKIKVYDVKTKKYVRVPREDCKIKRNKKPRGGDRLIANYKGRKLHMFVKKGYKL